MTTATVKLHMAHLVVRSVDLPSVNAYHELLHRGWPDLGERRYLFRADRLLDPETKRYRVVSFLVTAPIEHAPNWDLAATARPGAFLRREERTMVWEVTDGDVFDFFVRANTSTRRRVDRLTPEEVVKYGSPTGQYVVDVARNHDERCAWLREKASQSGFEVPSDPITSGTLPYVVKLPERDVNVPIYPCDFKGRLRVTDANLFVETLRTGVVGCRARVYGHGLLSIRKPTS